MELSSTENAILALLRSALTEQEAVLPPDLDWDALYAEAEIQAVTPLIADRLPASLPKEERTRWERRSCQYISFFYQLLEEQDRLIQVFREAQIPLVILKGSAAAIYYPDPVLRTMGDVDFVVPQDRFEEAFALMEASGYKVSDKKTPASAEIREVPFSRNGVCFELHHHFSNDFFDMEHYIKAGLAAPTEGQLEGYAFPMLPTLENGAVLLSHMCQHLRVKMGLRQVLDWMLFVDRVLDDAYWESSFRKLAEEFGMVTLAVTVTRMCQKYLGLSQRITWCAGADDALCDALLQSLFASGNFARKLGRESDVETALNGFKRVGLFRFLQERGEVTWEALERHPRLRPFAWLYQLFRYARLTVTRGVSAGQMKENAGKSREFNGLLRDLGLE